MVKYFSILILIITCLSCKDDNIVNPPLVEEDKIEKDTNEVIKYALTSEFIESQLADAKEQLLFLGSKTKVSTFPGSYSNGKYTPVNSSVWTSGFFPGSLLYLYEYSKDPNLIPLIVEKLNSLEKEKLNTSTHDLGFMLYCSFGNALRLLSDSLKYQEILVTGANSLSTRYSEKTKVIKSWDGEPFSVIIDNMMNLEFLVNAFKISGNLKFKDIAIEHANTTIKNHFRKDYSSYQLLQYNSNTGAVIGKRTVQGAFHESGWSRGQSWGLYGYTMMFREINDEKYLIQAHNIANYYLSHLNLPSDLIPYWDMDTNQLKSDNIYYKDREIRDASTAAIVASALLELAQYTKGEQKTNYIRKAEKMITSLSTKPYKADYMEAGGFVLKHSVGSLPRGFDVDVPLTYADYYYLEALIRYYKLLKGKGIFESL